MVSSEICYLKSAICYRRGRYFCSVGAGVEAGAFVAGGFAGWLVCAGGVGSPRIPFLEFADPPCFRLYLSLAYSDLACLKTGMSGSASFHSARKS